MTDDNIVRPNFKGDDGRTRSLEQFQVHYASQWNSTPPAYNWMVEGCFLRGTVAMISGDGGVGKSLLLQMLLTALALGRPWLGIQTQPVKTFGFFCEDDMDELHRRQQNINRLYGIEGPELELNFALTSRVGQENILLDFDRRNDQPKQTSLFNQLRQAILAHGAEVLVIDTVADAFGGNEVVRNHVRRFITRLRRLAMEMAGGTGGLIVLTQHPSVMGMSTGTGLSGSSAWNNSVRSRLYLTRDKSDETEFMSQEQLDAQRCKRVLKGMKNNYGQITGDIRLEWRDGVFHLESENKMVNENESSSRVGARKEGNESKTTDADIVSLMEALVGLGNRLAADPRAPNYVGKQLTAGGIRLPLPQIASTIRRLITEGKVDNVEVGPPSRRYTLVRPSFMRYAEEKDS